MNNINTIIYLIFIYSNTYKFKINLTYIKCMSIIWLRIIQSNQK